MSKAAACFQSRMLQDSFVRRLHVTASDTCDNDKGFVHLNKRYLGLLKFVAASLSDLFPTFRKNHLHSQG
jgi:hypothetical protein